MKKILLSIALWLLLLPTMVARPPKHEFRATWLATVSSIDWPKTKATSEANRLRQQKELTDILDKMVAGNMNAICMQVRALCDAMYQSSYEPWSAALTGTRGQDPGYDPLAFAVEEAHKRGLELHVWVNPFRASTSSLATSDPVWNNAGEWLIKYNNEGSFMGYIIDPGYPDARAYVIKVLMEIINRYDVDGIVMDDYFYAYGGTTNEDQRSQTLYYHPAQVSDMNNDGNTLDDWRRSNVDAVIKGVYDSIQSVKPWVKMGMGSGGIWTVDAKAATAYGITLPEGIRGADSYTHLYCNPIEWIKNGYVDYVNPQLYWSTRVPLQDYDVLCKWWSQDVCEHFSNQLPNGKKVYFFPSPAAYKAYDGSKGYEDGVLEIQREIDANRANLSSGYTGAVFYNTTSYLKMHSKIANSHFIHKALTPPIDWKVTDTLSAPENLTLEGTTLTWSHPTANRFTVYAYPKGIALGNARNNPTYLQKVVNGYSFDATTLGDLTHTTLAVFSYDRYGVEHGVALYNEDKNAVEGPEPEWKPAITWELNGGEFPHVDVPTREELWDNFKKDFDAFYAALYPNYVKGRDLPTTSILEYTWPSGFSQAVGLEFMTQHPDWLWLAEYIQSIAGVISDVRQWRFNLYAFFNATNKVYYASGEQITWAEVGDFTQAGLPQQWGPAYQASKGMYTLPTSVNATYVLPTTLYHPDGYPFLGWWDNPMFVGTSIDSIPPYWRGTLHANWEGMNPPDHLEEVIDLSQPITIYDVMGRLVGNSVDNLQGGVFIIKQGTKTAKYMVSY